METSKNSSHNLLTPFLDYLQSQYKSDNTVEAYAADLKDFAKWYAHTVGEELKPELVTELDLAEYRQYLMVRNYRPSTINRRRAAISKWLQWAYKEKMVQRLPELPPKNREEKLVPKALSRSEQNALLRAVMRDGKVRDQAIIYMLLFCGLRIGELVRLEVKDLELKRQGKVTVIGKGDKTREVPLPANVRKVLEEYLDGRDSGKVFYGQRGPLTERGVEEIITKYAYKARIEGLTPHVLRHTCATNLLNKGVDLVKVAVILGHENLNTTARYTLPTFQELLKAIGTEEE